MLFLKSVAENLYSRYGSDISLLTLVFPSRKAQLFFSEELTFLVDKPLWSPKFMSLEEVVSSFTSLKKVDDFSLLLRLYEVYNKHTKSSETFDKFYFWGETLLNDFDDIDKYCVNVEFLFKNLKAQKKLEGDFSFLTNEQIQYIKQFWSSFNPAKENILQDKFIEIWDVLLPVYTDFRSTLQQHNQAYSGMIYRDVAEKIRQNNISEIETKYVFVGFNALGKCETELFSYLKKQNKAEFYWDCDDYYVKDKMQEAGLFMRMNIEHFPAPSSFNLKSEFNTQKDIHIISSPSDVVQAKSLPLLIKEMNAPCDKKTAIVLADENILIPILHALPKECEDINITLGYPLVQTTVFTLTELLIRLQNSFNSNNNGFYYKDVLAVLHHKYVNRAAEVKEIVENITNNNSVYINALFFENIPFLKTIFVPLSGYKELAYYLINILADVATLPTNENEQVTLRNEYIYYITKALNRLIKSIEETNIEIGKSVFLSLVRDIFRNLKIPFVGEPIKGMQIMSIRETRALDFDNVIILSANEGRLPAETSKLSYIPYNLRKGYGLPCNSDVEASSAYNFYRLIQRAKKARLVYSSKTDETRTGEMSRYLYQLKFESPFDIREYPLTFNINFKENNKIEIQKDDAIMNRLLRYTGNSEALSPSAICSYISCPLKFYFSKIVKLKQDDSIAEELPLNLMGNIIHKTMEKLYNPLKNKIASDAEMSYIYKNNSQINSLIDYYFAQEFYKTDVLPPDFNDNGKLIITRDVIYKYVKGILKYDKSNNGFVPLGFETKVRTTLNVNGLTVNLAGIIDRVDKFKGNIRVVDYKTGAGRPFGKRMKINGVSSLFDRNPNNRNKEAFQTFLYSLMYKECMSEESAITPALYFVRDCYSPNFNYLLIDDNIIKTSDNKREDGEALKKVTNFSYYESDFKENLAEYLSELYNPNIPFVQTEYEKLCSNCPYGKICMR